MPYDGGICAHCRAWSARRKCVGRTRCGSTTATLLVEVGRGGLCHQRYHGAVARAMAWGVGKPMSVDLRGMRFGDMH